MAGIYNLCHMLALLRIRPAGATSQWFRAGQVRIGLCTHCFCSVVPFILNNKLCGWNGKHLAVVLPILVLHSTMSWSPLTYGIWFTKHHAHRVIRRTWDTPHFKTNGTHYSAYLRVRDGNVYMSRLLSVAVNRQISHFRINYVIR
jgi:hypothetical protein